MNAAFKVRVENKLKMAETKLNKTREFNTVEVIEHIE